MKIKESKKIKSPLLAGWLLKCLANHHNNAAIVGDMEEEYFLLIEERGRLAAMLRYWTVCLVSLPSFVSNLFFWRTMMIRNYFKTALRSIIKNKVYSIINIVGLAVGVSVALVIFLYVKTEFRYDAHHVHGKSLYRALFVPAGTGEGDITTYMPGPLAEALKSDFPQVLRATRFWGGHGAEIQAGDRSFMEGNIAYMDTDALNMFTLPLEAGNAGTALTAPHGVVLRKAVAQKYFGEEEALGQDILIDNETFTVTGVLEKTQHLSHLSFDILLPFAYIETKRDWLQSWGINAVATYIQLQAKMSPSGLEEDFAEEHGLEEVVLRFQSVDQIHLHSGHVGSDAFNTKPGSINTVRVFAMIGALLLIIACINFVNLSTAQSGKRAKEIGLRKVCGSTRMSIIAQVLFESLFIAFLAYGVALVLVQFWLKAVNPLLTTSLALQWNDGFIGLGLALFSGFVAGIYPALLFSRHQPKAMLNSMKSSSRETALSRKIMVQLQFVVSIVLIAASLIVYLQNQFMLNKDLGFDKDNVICLPISNDYERSKIEVIKQALLEDSRIMGVAATTQPTGHGTLSMGLVAREDDRISVGMQIGSIDADYIPTMGMEIFQGRNFMHGSMQDLNEGVILNEAACHKLGWEDPVGKEFRPMDTPFFTKSAIRVVGVVKDFHFYSLRAEITPIAFFMIPSRYRNLVVRIKAGDPEKTVEAIKAIWAGVLPDSDFDYRFLDKGLEQQYRGELKMNQLILCFSLMIVFIACLGLLGLSAFTSEQRTKEIGVRKVLGGSVSQMVLLLSREFVGAMLLANVIAWPVAWFAMNRWLQNFAYRINLSLWIFGLAGLLALLVALITVGFQVIRAARLNPVKSLKYE